MFVWCSTFFMCPHTCLIHLIRYYKTIYSWLFRWTTVAGITLVTQCWRYNPIIVHFFSHFLSFCFSFSFRISFFVVMLCGVVWSHCSRFTNIDIFLSSCVEIIKTLSHWLSCLAWFVCHKFEFFFTYPSNAIQPHSTRP